MRFTPLPLGALLLVAAPAAAQDVTAPPPPVRVTGGATLVSDYRFRGLSQTDGNPAAQATLNLNSTAGFYAGTWASTIDESTPALAGHGDAEVDLYGGYTKTLNSGVTLDGGLLYYWYPGGRSGRKTDYFEPYASLGYTIGPISAKLGAAYAWGGQAALDAIPGKDDSLYLYGESSIGVPRTPITLKAHLGRAHGALGAVNLDPGDHGYWDWSVTGEGVGGPIRVGVSYVDTNVTSRYVPALHGRFDQRLVRGSTVLGYIGFTF